MKAVKYPSIGQFRNTIKAVRSLSKNSQLVTLTMSGTAKVHGTNASVLFSEDGTQHPQSKNSILTIEEDNHGFAKWHSKNKDVFSDLYKAIVETHEWVGSYSLVIYGEWAGKGIQKKVAVSKVDPFFYVFGVKIIDADGSMRWLAEYPFLERGTDIIDSRKVWLKELRIDFEAPDLVQDDLIRMTNEVEEECPVGKYFGVSGVGEGVVWSCVTEDGQLLIFKVKGEKHSVTKVKKMAKVDTEKMNSIREFIDYAVTDKRLEQGFFEVCNNLADKALMGDLIRWVIADLRKEESDTLLENSLAVKDIGGPVSRRVNRWFNSHALKDLEK